MGENQAPNAVPTQPGAGGLAQDMDGVGFDRKPQPPPQQDQNNRLHLNRLYPKDMMNQPFQVTEFDLSPTPIVLPPNTRGEKFQEKRRRVPEQASSFG